MQASPFPVGIRAALARMPLQVQERLFLSPAAAGLEPLPPLSQSHWLTQELFSPQGEHTKCLPMEGPRG